LGLRPDITRTAPGGRLWAVVLLLACTCLAAHAGEKTVHFFFSPSCKTCHLIEAHMKEVLGRHPGFHVERYNINEPRNVELLVDMQIAYDVPDDAWGGTSAVFVGRHWWTEREKFEAEFEDALVDLGSVPEGAGTAEPGEAQSRLVQTFEQFGVVAVAAAGLADGINPCALAALIFLISYLSCAQRAPREILATGLLFAGGIFAAYLGVGLGMFRGLQMLSGFELASKLLYPVMAAGTLVLTVLSGRDWLRARAGKAGEMTLKLPRKLIGLSHGTIRRLIGGPWFLTLAFVAGLVISLLELLCTGQIYLPTLLYISSTEALRARAVGLLLIYVALFTLPVIVLTVAAYVGVTSERIAAWGRRHAATGKLALALVFLILSVYLVGFSLHVWAGA